MTIDWWKELKAEGYLKEIQNRASLHNGGQSWGFNIIFMSFILTDLIEVLESVNGLIWASNQTPFGTVVGHQWMMKLRGFQPISKSF